MGRGALDGARADRRWFFSARSDDLNVAVVIPVGPGHEKYALDADRSVGEAWTRSQGPFDAMHIAVVPDHQGTLGRSAARNLGVRENPADWYFFLDADDEMLPRAFELVRLEHPATFGAVCLNRKVYRKNVYPVNRALLFKRGAVGTLSMGCFVRADVARAAPFDESMDAGEDFDFYLRLPGFVKIKEPLVSIGYDKPSAHGRRGYLCCDWGAVCAKVIQRYS